MRRLLAFVVVAVAAATAVAQLAVGGGSAAVAAPRIAAHSVRRAASHVAPPAAQALAPAGQTCFVDGGSCSEQPCTQFIGAASAPSVQGAGCARYPDRSMGLPHIVERRGGLRGPQGLGRLPALRAAPAITQALALAQRSLALRLRHRAHR